MQSQSFFFKAWLLQSQVSQPSQNHSYNHFSSKHGCYSHKCHNHHRNTLPIHFLQSLIIPVTSVTIITETHYQSFFFRVLLFQSQVSQPSQKHIRHHFSSEYRYYSHKCSHKCHNHHKRHLLFPKEAHDIYLKITYLFSSLSRPINCKMYYHKCHNGHNISVRYPEHFSYLYPYPSSANRYFRTTNSRNNQANPLFLRQRCTMRMSLIKKVSQRSDEEVI
jgi:hypothetical protein